MYNQDRKMMYINEHSEKNNNIDKSISKFKSLSEFEEIYQKDLCDFSVDEIVEMYKNLYNPHFYSMSTINSLLKSYTRFCQSKGMIIDGKNHYNEITNDVLVMCVNPGLLDSMIVPDRREIIRILKSCGDNPADQFICLAIFDGICGKNYSDLVELRFRDFDKVNKTVKLKSGKILNVEPDLIDLAEDASIVTQRYSYKTSRTNQLIPDGDLIIKNGAQFLNGNYEVNQKVRLRIEAVKDFTGYLVFSRKNLCNSGMIYYIRKIMEETKCEVYDALNSDFIRERYNIEGVTKLMRIYGRFF